MQKVEALKLALTIGYNDFFMCNSEKVVAPIQRSTLAPLIENGQTLFEKYADQFYEVFSNHLALNFSFAESENVKAIDETNLNLDFESLLSLRKLLEQQGTTNTVLKKCLIAGVVIFSSIIPSLT